MILPNSVAVITGASSGIGAAVAVDLDRADVRLVLTARREDRLHKLADQCKDAAVVVGDVLDPELPQRLIDVALDRFGQCDIFLNNAGVIETGKIETIDIERVCQMVRINVEAAFRMAYVALRHFGTVGRGHLINTSSLLGTKVRPTAGAYAGTKFAIEALSEALRLETAGTNVKVSCLEPGLVRTELHDRLEVHPTESMNVPHPLLAEDIARCVRFLLEQPEHVRITRMMVVPGEQQF